MQPRLIYTVLLSLRLLCTVCSGIIRPTGQKNTVTCVYNSASAARNQNGRVFADEIPAEFCTYAVYAYASFFENKIFTTTPQIDDSDSGQAGNIGRFVSLKQRNPSLKTLIGLGGWSAGGWIFSQMAAVPDRRKMLIQSIVTFCAARELDGIFIEWSYPGVGQRGGSPNDTANFAALLTEMRAAFDAPELVAVRRLIIALTVSPYPEHLTGYDVPVINNVADLVYVATFDLAGYWNHTINHPSPLYSDEGLSVDSAVQLWLKAGVSSSKLVFGIPTFARTYKAPKGMKASEIYGGNFSGDGKAGSISLAPGFLYYSETCTALKLKSFTVNRDDERKVPYATSADELIMYEDEESIKEKANYANAKGLAGVYLYSIDEDDAKGFCGDHFPLTKALASVMLPKAKSTITKANATAVDKKRYLSLSSDKDCKEVVECLQYPKAVTSNVTDYCGGGSICVDPISILECPLPRSLVKKNVFSLMSAIFVGSSMQCWSGKMSAVQCRDSFVNGASNRDDTFYVCVQNAMLGPAVVEYVCPPGSRYSAYQLKCVILPKTAPEGADDNSD